MLQRAGGMQQAGRQADRGQRAAELSAGRLARPRRRRYSPAERRARRQQRHRRGAGAAPRGGLRDGLIQGTPLVSPQPHARASKRVTRAGCSAGSAREPRAAPLRPRTRCCQTEESAVSRVGVGSTCEMGGGGRPGAAAHTNALRTAARSVTRAPRLLRLLDLRRLRRLLERVLLRLLDRRLHDAHGLQQARRDLIEPQRVEHCGGSGRAEVEGWRQRGGGGRDEAQARASVGAAHSGATRHGKACQRAVGIAQDQHVTLRTHAATPLQHAPSLRCWQRGSAPRRASRMHA